MTDSLAINHQNSTLKQLTNDISTQDMNTFFFIG